MRNGYDKISPGGVSDDYKEENDKIYTLENMGREISPGWASDDNEKENDKIYNVNDNCSGHGRKEIT